MPFTEAEIFCLRDRPAYREAAGRWFHEKWGVPLAEYRRSIDACLAGPGPVPQWYLAVQGGRIVGGAGVIDNDFHDRKDLTPNLCALYVEPDCRGRGLAGALLAAACADMARRGFAALYLITDHTAFYERYGWQYLCQVRPDGEEGTTRMYRRSLRPAARR